jgi:multisubunit Na+/H+ antiporter MnhG subunit
MDLWGVVAEATTTTITSTTRAATTTVHTSTTLGTGGQGANGRGELIAALVVTLLAAIIGPILSHVLTRRYEQRKAEADRRALLAKEREAAREARRARVTIAYTPPAPGSNRFGSLDLINDGPSVARDVTWRVDENPGGPVVTTEAQVGGDPHHIKKLPPTTRLPVGWVARPVGRSEALSIVLTWKDGEGYNERRVTVLVPP